MKEKKWVADMSARRYRQARKKEKTVILNEFVQVTGYGRSYARLVLRNQGRVVQVKGRRINTKTAAGTERLPKPRASITIIIMEAPYGGTLGCGGSVGRLMAGVN